MTEVALVVVDMLNDFMAGGSLEVPHANDILPKVNELIEAINNSVAVQDWHPGNHYSFASNAGVPPFTMKDGEMKWPVHCVAGSHGSEFHSELNRNKIRAIFRKGMDPEVESYSGVFDAKHRSNGLMEYLEAIGVEKVFVCGLALDYCVGSTAEHLGNHGFETYIVSDATKPVNPDYHFSSQFGVEFATTDDVIASLQKSP